MSEEIDNDNWDDEREKEWEQHTCLALSYANTGLPRCHPSYRNQTLIPEKTTRNIPLKPYSAIVNSESKSDRFSIGHNDFVNLNNDEITREFNKNTVGVGNNTNTLSNGNDSPNHSIKNVSILSPYKRS